MGPKRTAIILLYGVLKIKRKAKYFAVQITDMNKLE
jgi:hypothetical protein